MTRNLLAVVFFLSLAFINSVDAQSQITVNGTLSPTQTTGTDANGTNYTISIGPLPVTVTYTAAPSTGGSTLPYTLRGSAVFNGSSAYLSRVFGTPTGAGKVCSDSLWIKRTIDGPAVIMSTTGSDYYGFTGAGVGTGSADAFNYFVAGAGFVTSTDTEGVGGFDHWLIAIDTTQAAPADRVHIYHNGNEVSYASAAYPAQNAIADMCNASIHALGGWPAQNFWSGMEVADFYHVDGQQLTPAAFINGQGAGNITPKPYTGMLGAQGVHLSFCSQATLGADDASGAQCNGGGPNGYMVTNANWSTDSP